MWSSNLRRESRPKGTTLAAAGLVLLLGLAGGNCAPGYVTGNNAPVNLIIAGISGGDGEAVLNSDVRRGELSNLICPDYATVAVAVRNKNPNAPTPNVPSAVIIRSYEVRYIRSDGRAVEGADVPYRITGNLTAAVDVLDSGTSDIAIEVVRRQAKTEPPLSTIYQTSVLTMMAEISLYGETVAGQAVSSRGRLQIDFADYGDDDKDCGTGPSSSP